MIIAKNSRPSQTAAELSDDRAARRTVIPAPRQDGMFSGWGVRF